jgi:hypothetical protein
MMDVEKIRIEVTALTSCVIFDRSHHHSLNSFIYETGTIKLTSLFCSTVIGMKRDTLEMFYKLKITVQM